MTASYVPEAGDVVWLQFDPRAGHEQAGHEQAGHEQAGHEQAGHEQGGHRPAVVLSPASYNGRAGMMICCPMTTRIKGYPFEVAVGGAPASVVLADQVKSLDWRARRAVRKGRVGAEVLAAVRGKLGALIGVG